MNANGPSWYERAEDELCEELNNGEITLTEYNRAMRDLNDELRQSAQEAADDAYNKTMGGW